MTDARWRPLVVLTATLGLGVSIGAYLLSRDPLGAGFVLSLSAFLSSVIWHGAKSRAFGDKIPALFMGVSFLVTGVLLGGIGFRVSASLGVLTLAVMAHISWYLIIYLSPPRRRYARSGSQVFGTISVIAFGLFLLERMPDAPHLVVFLTAAGEVIVLWDLLRASLRIRETEDV